MPLLQPGTLWQRIVSTTESALRNGDLLPIPTAPAFIDDGGVRFAVRVLASLRRKTEARREQNAQERTGRPSNPFLPPEQGLVIADLTGTHLAILNKFNVVDHHLLIITRQFEDQELLLTLEDFEALWLCMAEFDGLGFYNGGTAAGASQRHRHLQMVPLPLTPEGPSIPMEPLLAKAPLKTDGLGTVPDFPFSHAYCRIDPQLWRSPAHAAPAAYARYCAMLRRLGMRGPEEGRQVQQDRPYCLLVTRSWMLLVPRSREHAAGVSFNSLAYAASLFVGSEEQLAQLRAYGPMRALRDVALPW